MLIKLVVTGDLLFGDVPYVSQENIKLTTYGIIDSLTAVPPCKRNRTKCAAQCLPNQKYIETPSGHRLIHLGRVHFRNGNVIEVCDGILFELSFKLQIDERFFQFGHLGTDRFMIE